MKVAVLLESDFYEPELFYYERRFEEENIELDFVTRLWGNSELSFRGHEYGLERRCGKSFEDLSDDDIRDYSAIIVPSGMVADRLRYTEDPKIAPPATRFLARAFSYPSVLKGIICHGALLMTPMPWVLRGRKMTAHNNLLGDLRNMGAVYVDEDVVVDRDFISGRSGAQCQKFAHTIIEHLQSNTKNH